VDPPTATQEEADGHEIPPISTMPLPAGSAITVRDHPRPFHRSANNTSRFEKGNGKYVATAVQAVLEEQDIENVWADDGTGRR
jgi:hypothetical protein